MQTMITGRMGLLALTIWSVTELAGAWTSGGHQLVALMAYRQLSPEQKAAAGELLTHLPAFDHDIGRETAHLPTAERHERIFMLASTWPDLVRSAEHPAFREHRAEWHTVRFPLVVPGTTVTSGTKPMWEEPPGGKILEVLPRLQQDLATSSGMSLRERAIALAWILHQIGDLHQPLHAVSLYSDQWPKGDHVATRFFVTERQGARPVSLHRFWDALFGGAGPAEQIRARADELEKDPALSREQLSSFLSETSVSVWAQESVDLSRRVAYRLESGRPLQGAAPKVIKSIDIPPFTAPLLPSDYEEGARKVARQRAALAAHRMADYLKGSLKPEELKER